HLPVVTAERDGVLVQVHGYGVDDQSVDPRLLGGLTEGGTGQRLVTRLAVTTELEPALRLAVQGEQDPPAVGGQDDRAGRDVVWVAAALEPVGVVVEVTPEAVAQLGLLWAGRHPCGQGPQSVVVQGHRLIVPCRADRQRGATRPIAGVRSSPSANPRRGRPARCRTSVRPC